MEEYNLRVFDSQVMRNIVKIREEIYTTKS
jgi:hypothetical protein